jgi:predicted small lipoprotein YifL
VAWLTLLAIAGTLCACGRYGPPTRRAPEASTTGAASDSAVPPTATTDEDEDVGKFREEWDD